MLTPVFFISVEEDVCMLEMLILALRMLHKESSQLGLEINWSQTKLQAFVDTSTLQVICTRPSY